MHGHLQAGVGGIALAALVALLPAASSAQYREDASKGGGAVDEGDPSSRLNEMLLDTARSKPYLSTRPRRKVVSKVGGGHVVEAGPVKVEIDTDGKMVTQGRHRSRAMVGGLDVTTGEFCLVTECEWEKEARGGPRPDAESLQTAIQGFMAPIAKVLALGIPFDLAEIVPGDPWSHERAAIVRDTEDLRNQLDDDARDRFERESILALERHLEQIATAPVSRQERLHQLRALREGCADDPVGNRAAKVIDRFMVERFGVRLPRLRSPGA
ncbi:MAG: hypothetical protein KC416_12045 [Myxococcales bacterium]|nr:hypothetical protein [Myxococcales bacterium]